MSQISAEVRIIFSQPPPSTPQMTSPTSSASSWTRTRPSFLSTPSHHCRFNTSVWIIVSYFIFNIYNEDREIQSLLPCGRLPRSSVGNTEQQRERETGILSDGQTLILVEHQTRAAGFIPLFSNQKIWVCHKTQWVQPQPAYSKLDFATVIILY